MRHAKQFLYGLFYLIFLSAAGSGVYYLFFKPAPPPCVNCNQPLTEPLAAGSVYALPLAASATGTSASFVAEIRNPNPDWGATGFTYTFHAYAADGTDLGSFSGSSYIYPGEIKYVALPNQPVADAPATTTLVLSSPAWTPSANFSRPDITATLVRTDEGQVISAEGTVMNNGAIPVRVDLVALFYDGAGSLSGASVGAITRVEPRTSGQFVIFHPVLPNIVPERTQIYAYAYAIQ